MSLEEFGQDQRSPGQSMPDATRLQPPAHPRCAPTRPAERPRCQMHKILHRFKVLGAYSLHACDGAREG